MDALNAFPGRLKALRNHLQLSQEKLAAIMGVTRPTIGYYEKGQRTPDIGFLDKLHRETGCSIEYLMGYKTAMREENEATATATGLTDESIEQLGKMIEHREVFNFIISHPDFLEFIGFIQMVYNAIDNAKSVHTDDGIDVANVYMEYSHQALCRIVSDFCLARFPESHKFASEVSKVVYARTMKLGRQLIFDLNGDSLNDDSVLLEMLKKASD